MGTFDRRPFGVQVTDIPLTFMLDNDGYVLKLCNDWTNSIVNYDFGNTGEFGKFVFYIGVLLLAIATLIEDTE